MNSRNVITLALILMAAGFMVLSTAAFAQESTERRPTREKWEELTIEALVEAVDSEKREVLLRGPEGNLVTITADETVKRFGEIEVGDKVTTRFWTYMMAEFREPTEAEIAEPLVILAEWGKAPEDMPPGAAVGQTIKGVVTIEIINRPDMYVTVQGPLGNYLSIPVEDKEIITQLNIGEVIVLTYAEAVAMTLEKID